MQNNQIMRCARGILPIVVVQRASRERDSCYASSLYKSLLHPYRNTTSNQTDGATAPCYTTHLTSTCTYHYLYLSSACCEQTRYNLYLTGQPQWLRRLRPWLGKFADCEERTSVESLLILVAVRGLGLGLGNRAIVVWRCCLTGAVGTPLS